MFLYERLIYLAFFFRDFVPLCYEKRTRRVDVVHVLQKKNTFCSTSLIVTHDNGSNNRQVYGGIRLLDPYSMEP
jgi:hypothetical protein